MKRIPSLIQLCLLLAIAGDLNTNLGHSYEVPIASSNAPPGWFDNPLHLRGARQEKGIRGGGAVNMYWSGRPRMEAFASDSSEEEAEIWKNFGLKSPGDERSMSIGSDGMSQDGSDTDTGSESSREIGANLDESISGDAMEFVDVDEENENVDDDEREDCVFETERPRGVPRSVLTRTERLSARSDLGRVLDMIRRSRRILVVTGAGISASCGIPTFRGSGDFYETVAQEFGLPDGQAVMDARFFREDPRPFFQVARRLYPSNYQPSKTHGFIRELEDAGRLLRDYTQNVDTLERSAGIRRVVYCHGSFATATCTRCHHRYDGEAIEPQLLSGRVPICSLCRGAGGRGGGRGRSRSSESSMSSTERDGEGGGGAGDGGWGWARSSSSSSGSSGSDGVSGSGEWEGGGGVIRPDIVMFHEALPEAFYSTVSADVGQADMLLVMGTSLSVAPVSYLPGTLRHLPSVLINAEWTNTVEDGVFDVFVEGECDEAIAALEERGLRRVLREGSGEGEREGDYHVGGHVGRKEGRRCNGAEEAKGPGSPVSSEQSEGWHGGGRGEGGEREGEREGLHGASSLPGQREGGGGGEMEMEREGAGWLDREEAGGEEECGGEAGDGKVGLQRAMERVGSQGLDSIARGLAEWIAKADGGRGRTRGVLSPKSVIGRVQAASLGRMRRRVRAQLEREMKRGFKVARLRKELWRLVRGELKAGTGGDAAAGEAVGKGLRLIQAEAREGSEGDVRGRGCSTQGKGEARETLHVVEAKQ